MNKILISFLLLFSLFSSCSSPEDITLSPDGDEDVKPTIPIEKYKLSVEKPEHAKLQIEPLAPDSTYEVGTTVKVTVSVDDGYRFDGWTGDVSGTQTSLEFKMDADKTIGVKTLKIISNTVKWYVKTKDEFKKALNGMETGDTIVVADGTYNIDGQTINTGGTKDNPVLITAENVGRVTLNGKSSFTLRHVEYVTIRGFKFASEGKTVVKMEGSRYCRVTQNEFNLNEEKSNKWVIIGAHYQDTENKSCGNRIDHNLFEGKTQPGNYITIDGVSKAHQPSQNDTIDHNHFRNNSPRAANEKESIRVGWTDLSGGSSYTVIEHNLFENCDGDPEIISLKACYNIVRYNTFRRCLGTVCLRQGAYNRVEGNYFFGEGKTVESDGQKLGCGGVRVYGIGHVVVNNYFEGLTGDKWDPVLAITNGDKSNGGDLNNSSHLVPEKLIFAHNTMVNNKSNIEIGYDNSGKYTKKPVNCQIKNNIILTNTTDCIKLYTENHRSSIVLDNNIFYPTGDAQMGVTFSGSEIKKVDPKLEKATQVDGFSLFKPQQNSPAINAVSRIDDCLLDFEGQERQATTTIGADELSGTNVKAFALTEKYVGPYAIELK